MTSPNVRELALDILVRVATQSGYSHLLIDQTLKKNRMDSRDKGLLTEIVNGTIQRRNTLDYYLQPFLQKNKKLEPWVQWLLYMSIYQMIYLDRVPQHAIVHEAVTIAKKKGHKGIASLVNGILRNAQRKGFPSLEQMTDPMERLSIETSHPLWLIQRWIEQYGFEIVKEMCFENLGRPSLSLRVQTLRMNREKVIEKLKNDGIEAKASELSPYGIRVEDGSVLHHPLFTEGYLLVQDESSMLVAPFLRPIKGETVVDACAAPGGKATHIAEQMQDEGVIYAYDLHQSKVKKIEQNAKTLQLSIIRAKQSDSRQLKDHHQPESIDRLLLDAPCSGLGVIKGKPEIKYQKSEEDIRQLSKVQLELLEAVAPLVKVGGTLLYSTCTVDRQENEGTVSRFLEQHSEYIVDPNWIKEIPSLLKKGKGLSESGLQIFPQDFHSDGFFMVVLIKINSSK
ncbi:16S rRNA (cytosine(967)-C(5))-methyltransferase RsmB [Bacillaceae bacterium S4-13-56]